jgi:hypothetical protein
VPLPLDKTLRREIVLDDATYTVAVGPTGVKITPKGFRKGRELSWRAILALGTDEGARHGLRDQSPPADGSQRNTRSRRQ